MALDAATKKKILKRVEIGLNENEALGEAILEGKWDVFRKWLKKACSDIWSAIKDYVSNIWNWVTDLFS